MCRKDCYGGDQEPKAPVGWLLDGQLNEEAPNVFTNFTIIEVTILL